VKPETFAQAAQHHHRTRHRYSSIGISLRKILVVGMARARLRPPLRHRHWFCKGRQELVCGKAGIPVGAGVSCGAWRPPPHDASAHRGMAEVYRRKNKRPEAIRSCKLPWELRDSAVDRTTLARIYLEQRKTDLAKGRTGAGPEDCAKLYRSPSVAGAFAERKHAIQNTMKSHSALRPSNLQILAELPRSFFCSRCVRKIASRRTTEHSVPIVMDLNLEGEVEPVLGNLYRRGPGLDAARRNSSLVLIAMDTPCGPESDSMKDIIQHILGSSVRWQSIVERPARAGAIRRLFILLSADVCGHGACHAYRRCFANPSAIGGFTIGVDSKHCARKSPTTPWLSCAAIPKARAQCQARGNRGPPDARAFHGNRVASMRKLIDYVAASPEELLRNLNGKTITRFDGTKTHLGPHKLISAYHSNSRPRQKFSRAHRRAGHVFPAADIGRPRPVC